MKCYFHSTSII